MTAINRRTRFLSLLPALGLLLSTAGCGAAAAGTAGASTATEASQEAAQVLGSSDEYGGFFDESRVHTLDVTIAEEDWEDLQANPLNKTKYKVSVTLDGETVENVSFATKGNTSLSSVASDPDSNRYSFKINFGKYEKGQSYHGLNKLNLNNIYADATYMKDWLSYRLFRELGVESPLTSYVWLTVNGEDQGLYLAIEDVSESYLERTAQGEGELYKPETESLDNMGQAPGGNFPDLGGDNQGQSGQFPGIGGNNQGQGGQFPGFGGNGQGQGGQPPFGGGQDQNGQPPFGGSNGQDQGGQFPSFGGNQNQSGQFPGFGGGEQKGADGNSFPGNMPGPGGDGTFQPGFFGGDAKGADLKYTDDDPESYSDIFDNDETDADDASQARVIAALKALSQGQDLDAVLDTDEIIRYFAAHNFVLNYDSYTGVMLHNYYLYEKDGKLALLPWDYNLAFGGFSNGGDATALINTGIDSPLSGAQESARPMWSWITGNEAWLTQYHEALEELVSGYFASGRFEQEVDALYALLLPYMEKDPSAFYTAEEYTTGVNTLKEFCLKRAQSIQAQLAGRLATVTEEQEAADRIDASGLQISAMGTHGGGQENSGGPGGAPSQGAQPDGNRQP